MQNTKEKSIFFSTSLKKCDVIRERPEIQISSNQHVYTHQIHFKSNLKDQVD